MVDDPPQCLICGSERLRALPSPGERSMMSDGAILGTPLVKFSCSGCSSVTVGSRQVADDISNRFKTDYCLFDHPVGEPLETARQTAYAQWLFRFAAIDSADTIFEIGSGNGSFLKVLEGLKPSAEIRGIEPNPVAASHARAAQLCVETGYLSPADQGAARYDTVISINVIEHTPDPVEFLRRARGHLRETGQLIIVCPDGEKPGSELLIADHVVSFTREAMAMAAQTAGLGVSATEAGPAELTSFRAYRLVPTLEAAEENIGRFLPDPARFFAPRAAYLQTWLDLGAELSTIVQDFDEIIGFGAGEMAGLFRTYLSRIWDQLDSLTIDGGDGKFAGKTVSNYADLIPVDGRLIIPLIDPPRQKRLCDRLSADGHQVIAWYAHLMDAG